MFPVKKSVTCIALLAFIAHLGITPLQAGEIVVPLIPKPGVMVSLSHAFTPAMLKGIVIHPDNALRFDFLVDQGDSPLRPQDKDQEYNKLIKYFLASLTIPDQNQWVNLSPYEKERIIEDNFGKTEMGRDLLAQDYLLKQITSSLMYPDSGLGKEFWNKVYERAYKELGHANIPVNTFNKVWIVPDQATIYESGNTAYVVKSHLKVMLEEDYLARQKHAAGGTEAIIFARSERGSMASSLATQRGDGFRGDKNNSSVVGPVIANQIIREVLLPELEREVNQGQNFANLRQIFSGMLLATWYKKTLKESLLGKIYADKAKVGGVDLLSSPKASIGDPQTIYTQYLEAFKKGVYNFIKEDEDRFTKQMIPRKYFAGGATQNYATLTNVIRVSSKELNQAMSSEMVRLDQATVSLDQRINKDAAMKNEEIIFKDFDEFSRKVISRHMVKALKVEAYMNPEIREYMAKARQAFELDRIGFNVILNLVNDAEYPADNNFLTNLGKMKANASAALEILFPIERDKREYQRIFYFFKTITDVLSLELRSLSEQNVVTMNKEKIEFKRFSEFKRPDLFDKLKEALEWGSLVDPLKQGVDLEIMLHFFKFEEVFNRDAKGFNNLMNIMRPYVSWEEFYQSKELKEFHNTNPTVVDALFPLGGTEAQKERFQYNFLFAQTVLDTIDDANEAMLSGVAKLKLTSPTTSDNFIFESFEAFAKALDTRRTINILRIDGHDDESIAQYKGYFKEAYDADPKGFHLFMRLVNDSETAQDAHYLNGRENLVRDHRKFLEILFSGSSTEEEIDNIFWFAKEVVKQHDAAMGAISRRALLVGAAASTLSSIVQSSVNPKRGILNQSKAVSLENVDVLMKKMKDTVDALEQKVYLFYVNDDLKKAIENWERISDEVEDNIERIDEFNLGARLDEENSEIHTIWLEIFIQSMRTSLIRSLNNIFEQEMQRLDSELTKYKEKNNIKGMRAIKKRLDMIMTEYGSYFPNKIERIDDFKKAINQTLDNKRVNKAMLGKLGENFRKFIMGESINQNASITAGITPFWAKKFLLSLGVSREEMRKNPQYLRSIKDIIDNYMLGRVVGVETSEEFELRLKILLQEFNKQEFIDYIGDIKKMAVDSEFKSRELIALIYRLKKLSQGDQDFKNIWTELFKPLVNKVHAKKDKLDQGYKVLDKFVKLLEKDKGSPLLMQPLPSFHGVGISDFGELLDTNDPVMRASDLGGIDFNATHLNIEIKKDGNGVPLPIAQQDLNRLALIDGFVPRIIEIKPVSSLPQFQVK